MTVRLRDAQRAERDQLEQLLAEYLLEFDGAREPYPYLDAYWEERERLPFLIEADGDLVGLCLIRRRDDHWGIAEFTVVPGERRRGVGRAAVDALAVRARSEGCAYLEATVQLDKREALAFWLAVGFTEDQEPAAGAIVTRRSL